MFAHHFYYMFPLKQKKIHFSSRDSECGTRQLNNSGLFSLETKQRAIKNLSDYDLPFSPSFS